jgi:hypothetical protein
MCVSVLTRSGHSLSSRGSYVRTVEKDCVFKTVGNQRLKKRTKGSGDDSKELIF